MNATHSSKKEPKSGQKQAQIPPEPTIGLQEYWIDQYHCCLVKRKENIALFRQFTEFGKPNSWEVIIIQSNKKREFPPSSEEWGRWGWSFIEYESALRVFEKMTEGT